MQVPRLLPASASRILLSLLLTTTAATTAVTATADTIDVLHANTTAEMQTAVPAALPEPEPGPVSAAVHVNEFGMALDVTLLEQQRGGADLGTPVPVSGILSTGVVSDNRATDVVTGSNVIRDGAFTNASGIPVVIQNTGANVLIQNSTIVNLQLH